MNPEAEHLHDSETDNLSNEPQEALAAEYLSLHKKWTELMAEWENILHARDRNMAESGHMPDIETADAEYKKRMDEIGTQMDECEARKKVLFDQMSDETKEQYLNG